MSKDFKIIRLLKQLARIEGRHTELISVYIPAGFDIEIIKNQLEQEAHTASNIKDKNTRKNVIDALQRILNELKLVKRTPPNGLVIFCGNISPREGEPDIQLWSFEPPKPISIRLYRCDQQFVVEPLLSLYEPVKKYGLIVIDIKEATIGMLENTRIIPLKRLTSLVPGKFRKGGQSAMRLEREREGLILGFLEEVSDAAKFFFYNEKLEGILVGGPGTIKEALIERLPTELQKKVIAVKPTQYTDEYGLKELVDESRDLLTAIKEEANYVDIVLSTITQKDYRAVITLDKIQTAVDDDNAQVILISDGLDENLQEKLYDMAKSHNIPYKFISTDTSEGQEFLNLGGMAAILKRPKQY
jgi:peptide chain release factor subunit 1